MVALKAHWGRLTAIIVFPLASRFRAFYISWDVLSALAQDFLLISDNLTLFNDYKLYITLLSCLETHSAKLKLSMTGLVTYHSRVTNNEKKNI